MCISDIERDPTNFMCYGACRTVKTGNERWIASSQICRNCKFYMTQSRRPPSRSEEKRKRNDDYYTHDDMEYTQSTSSKYIKKEEGDDIDSMRRQVAELEARLAGSSIAEPPPRSPPRGLRESAPSPSPPRYDPYSLTRTRPPTPPRGENKRYRESSSPDSGYAAGDDHDDDPFLRELQELNKRMDKKMKFGK